MEKFEILSYITNSKKIRGLSLIELIITIGIISILLTMILVNTNIINDRVEKSELKLLEKNINTTRNLSISSRKRYSIEFLTDNSYMTSYDNEIVNFKKLSFNFTHPSSNRKSFSFTEKGSPAYEGSGTIVIEGENNLYSISVTPAVGRVNIRNLE